MPVSLQVRTLFVSGLPMDVRLRELYLLFRCYEVHFCSVIEVHVAHSLGVDTAKELMIGVDVHTYVEIVHSTPF